MPEKTPIQKFYEMGQAFIARAKQAGGSDPCLAIKPGMEEWNHWATYFLRTCGSLPAAMRQVERGILATITVPARWPEWFDPDYRTPDVIPVRIGPWHSGSPHDRAASHARVMADAAREPPRPRPPSPGGVVTWGEVPSGTRIIGRFETRWHGARKDPPRADRSIAPAVSLEASPELVATLDRQRKGAAA